MDSRDGVSRKNRAFAPPDTAKIQWQPRGLRAELAFAGSGAATGGVLAEVHRDVTSLAGWVEVPTGGRRIAWRLELYADAPMPIEHGQQIAESLLSRAQLLARAIDEASRVDQAKGAILVPGESDSDSTGSVFAREQQ